MQLFEPAERIPAQGADDTGVSGVSGEQQPWTLDRDSGSVRTPLSIDTTVSIIYFKHF